MYDVVIIGSGPAGLTASIYTSRALFKTLVIEGPIPGGQITLTEVLENFPGFPNGIRGFELAERIRKQAEKFGVEFLQEEVKDITVEHPFKVITLSDTIECKAIVVATGASPRLLGLESERKLLSRGVSTCAVCDGPLFKGKKVAVIGGGDVAFEEANYLAKLTESVVIIHRRDKFRASEILIKRAEENPKISFILNANVKEIKDVEKGSVEGVLMSVEGKEKFLECQGVFVAIGPKPNTEIFKGKLEVDKEGYIITRDGMKTSVEGIFAAGDCQDRKHRQAISAAGAGCKAALEVIEFLRIKG